MTDIINGPSTPAISEKIARNSASSVLRSVLSLPLAFFVVPFTLKSLGAEQYGIWALVGILSTYVRLGDFGVGTAVVKYVAEYHATQETHKINILASTAAGFYVLVAVVILMPLLTFRTAIVSHLFNIPLAHFQIGVFVFSWAVLIHGFRLIFNIYTHLLYGLQRIDLVQALTLIYVLLNNLGIVVALAAGYGLEGMIMANALAAGVFGFLSWVVTRRTYPALKMRPGYFQIGACRKVLAYSFHVQVSQISNLALAPLSKIIITQIAGVSAVAGYEVASQVVAQARAFFGQAAYALLPAAAEIEVLHGKSILSRAYGRALRYLLLTVLPAYAFIFGVARPFMTAWLGRGYEHSAMALQTLTVATFFSICVLPIYLMFQGIGLTRQTMLISVETGILSAILSLGLGRLLGFQGVVLGMSLAMILTAGHTFWLFRLHVGFTLAQFWRVSSGRCLILFGLLYAGLQLALHRVGPEPSLTILVMIGLGYLAAYLLGLVVFRVLRLEDLRPAQNLIPKWVYGWLVQILRV